MPLLVLYNGLNCASEWNLPDEVKHKTITQDEALEIERIKKSLDMLDSRLDNLDSVVSAIVERMMKRFITLELTCPHCGKNIEIGLIGSEKLKK